MKVLKYLQLPFYFEPLLLQQDVQRLVNKPWQLHYQTLHYTGEWSALPLRSTGGIADNVIISPSNEKPYEDTVFLKECVYIKTVLQHFKCPLQAVRLLKLNAGAIIKEHRDAELNFENGEIRLHVPIITHADVEFILDKERLPMKAGECWYMNFNLPHSINNNSPVNRVHLVIDAVVNDWVKAIFNSPDIVVKKETEDLSGVYDAETKKQMLLHLREMNTAVSHKMANELEKEISAAGQ